jgi:hypothetical protein
MEKYIELERILIHFISKSEEIKNKIRELFDNHVNNKCDCSIGKSCVICQYMKGKINKKEFINKIKLNKYFKNN